MKTVKTILLILTTAAVIGACGLRGPLYLQDEAPTTAPAVEQDSTPDKEKESDPG